jgi:hypothetical protein
MKLNLRHVTVTALLCLALLTACAALWAQSFSHILSFQGRLADSGTGKPLPDGQYDVTFRIYDAASSGTKLWQESQTVEQAGGIFTAYLGTVTAFPSDLFTGGDRWMSLQVSGDDEMTDRFQFTPSVWALYAGSSGTDNDWAFSGNDIYRLSGNVGIGTSSPARLLHVGSKLTDSEGIIRVAHKAGGTYREWDFGVGDGTFFGHSDNFGFRDLAGDGQTIMVLQADGQGGNVGIGTLTPSRKLEVAGTICANRFEDRQNTSFFADPADASLSGRFYGTLGVGSGTPSTVPNIHATSGMDPASIWVGGLQSDPGTIVGAVDFIGYADNHQPADTAYAGIRGEILSSAVLNQGALLFYTATGTLPNAYKEQMRIMPDGKVGIGTQAPQQMLDVSGTAQMTGFKMPTGAASDYVLTSDANGVGTWKAASGGNLTGGGTQNHLAKWTGSKALGDSNMYETAGGNFGIGTTSPGSRFEVRGNGDAIRVASATYPNSWIQMQYHPSLGPLLQADTYGRLTLDAMAGTAGKIVLGSDNDRVGIGIIDPVAQLDVRAVGNRAGDFRSNAVDTAWGVLHSEFTGTNAQNVPAVTGYSKPQDGYGLGGDFQGGYIGVYGNVQPTGGAAYLGVYGIADGGSGTNYGVKGQATTYSSGASKSYGVYGTAAGPGKNYGVYGFVVGEAPNNYAGYFDGDVYCTGTLNAQTKLFRIDHPLDPSNKYLQHSCVESPDMMDIYNGNVVLDEAGEAWVEMPDWFEALNRDFRYQLTCIGGFAPVYVAEEVANNEFKIAGGTPGLKVSWQVTGIRHDPYAEAHRPQVEEEKPEGERGLYVHPELYGQPESMGVGHRHRPDQQRG